MESAAVKVSDLLGGKLQPKSEYRLKNYDFKRPNKFSKEQIRTIAIMHETFARLATTSFSTMLRCHAQVHVSEVAECTYGEFIRSLPTPTTLAVLNLTPLKGRAILEIDPAIGFAATDRLFGGKGEDSKLSRGLTGIEVAVLEGLVSRLIGSLREAWAQVLDLSPTLGQVVDNPQFAQIVPPTEMVVLVCLETELGGAKGMMNLCLPFLTIEPIIPKLAAQYWYSLVRKSEPSLGFPAIDLSTSLEVSFMGAPLSLRDLSLLRKGSLVGIPGYDEGRVLMKAGGCPLFHLKAERAGKTGRFAFRIEDAPQNRGLSFLKPAEAAAASDETGLAIAGFLRPFVEELGGTMKAINAKLSDIAKRQEELSDQLSFENPEKELAPVKEPTAQARPFERFSIIDCETLFRFIGQEHPQTIALVLSYLTPNLAACILEKLTDATRIDVTGRIASLARVAPEVLRVVERVLAKQVSSLGSEGYVEAGGIITIVEMLNLSSRSVEKQIIEALERKDPVFAENIKKNMFVFEDIVLLDDGAISKVLGRVDPELLLLAMKTVAEELRNRLWNCLPTKEAEESRARFAKMGNARLRDVEEAQQKIVGKIREMDESGEIIVARPDERV